MTYALIDNGEVSRVGLPRTGTLADGRTVSGFDLLPAATLKGLGWLPLDDPGPPEHDPATERVVRSYDVLQTKVNVVYAVEELPEPPPDPIEAVQDQLDQLTWEVLLLQLGG